MKIHSIMKNHVTWSALLLSAALSMAGAPQAFKYQAVARDNRGNIIPNQSITFRVSLHQNSGTGPLLYQELHAANTDAYGQVGLEIGRGTVVAGTFSTMDWGEASVYLKVEMDVGGGTRFIPMGVAELLSVPYAIFSASGERGPPGPKGDKGDSGAVGPAGPQGPPGVANVSIVNNTSPVHSGGEKSVTVDCPMGTVLTGGGAALVYSGLESSRVGMTASYPSSATSWSATAKEFLNTTRSWGIRAFAVCAQQP